MPLGKPMSKAAQNSEGVHLSLRPSDAESGGGLLDDVNATVTISESVTYDYNGKSEPGPSYHVHLKADDGSEADQYYSAGKLERVVPSEDGKHFDPAPGTSSKGLNDSTNAFMFLSTLVEKGFPEDKLSDLSSVAGLYAHFNRVPQKKRAGLENDGDKKKTILVVTKIINMPWEAKKGGVAGKSTGKTAPAASNGNADVNDEAVAAVVEVLAANDGSFKGKTKLGMACFRALPSSNANRSKVLKLVPTDAFLKQENDFWVYDESDESVTSVSAD